MYSEIQKVLNNAIFGGRIEEVRELLKDPNIDPAYDDNYAICEAIRYGNVEIFKLLQNDARVDINAGYNYPLWCAVALNNIDILNLLLADKRLNISYLDKVLAVAVLKERLEIIDILLSQPSINPTYKDHEALRLAEIYGVKGATEKLVGWYNKNNIQVPTIPPVRTTHERWENKPYNPISL